MYLYVQISIFPVGTSWIVIEHTIVTMSIIGTFSYVIFNDGEVVVFLGSRIRLCSEL